MIIYYCATYVYIIGIYVKDTDIQGEYGLTEE